MKVLIACEFSGVVRDEFLKLGHDAVSCDLLPSESDFGPHIQGDVLDVIRAENWNLMIAHPPCTYLTTGGNNGLFKNNPTRCKMRAEAFDFVMQLYNSHIPKICIENPQGYINTHFRAPDQTIHPYMFGDPEMKRTCLWLKNLPKLYYTQTYAKQPEPKYFRKSGQNIGKKIYFTECGRMSAANGLTRWQLRSRTFPGIARAMAVQWGSDCSQYFYEKYEK